MYLNQKVLVGCALLAMVPSCKEDDDFVQCPPASAIIGHSCNRETGEPVGNVTVSLTPKPGSSSCLTSVQVTADATGEYTVKDLRVGEYTITYTSEDGFKDERDLSVPELPVTLNDKGEEVAASFVKMEWPECTTPQGTIKGRLCDARTGLWVAGGEVYVKMTASKVSTTTDSEGYFTLAVEEGERTLIVENKDYHKEYPVTVVGEDTVTIGENECNEVPHGDVSGQICAWYDAASGNGYFVYGTKVFVEMGNFYQSTTTDADGKFTLKGIPQGEAIKVHAVKNRYSKEWESKVVGNQENATLEPQCLDVKKAKIAVITGIFENLNYAFEDLGLTTFKEFSEENSREIAQAIDPNGNISYIDGVTYNGDVATRYYQEQFLANLDWMEEFDIIYFASSHYLSLDGDNGKVASNIKLYLQNGGSIYASDNAYEALRVSIPSFVNWVGNESKDHEANVGTVATNVQTTIVDNNLAGALRHTEDKTMVVNFINPSWSVMESSQPKDTSVLVKGTVPTQSGSMPDAALVVSFTPFENGGKVIYSSISLADYKKRVTEDTLNMFEYLFFEL